MPIDFFKKFIGEFPYFFDKSESSNFYKIQTINSNRFKELYFDLFKIKNSFKLNKNLWIYKEQEEPHYYGMHFMFAFPLLKSVKIFREGEIVYSADFELSEDESFSYLLHEDFPDYFIKVMENEDEFTYIPQEVYTTEYTLEDNVQSIKIDIYSYSENVISNDNYHVEATTFEDYIITKGWPENDTVKGNMYDHDVSLDEIGEENNIPRKEYIEITDENLFPLTEPPYHNRLTEDDYHYMKRILNYLLKIHEIPLPCAEIWKLYGIDATLENRERLIMRMVDRNKHPEAIIYDEEGNIIDFTNEWVNKKWEHNDTLCPDAQEEIYFFVNVDNATPLRGTIINFTFDFVNMFNEPKNREDYIIIPYIDNEIVEDTEITENTWSFDTNNLNDENDNVFVFKVYNKNDLNNTVFISTELQIILRDCKNANWYVNPTTGDDSNNGDKENPFKTINEALNHLDEVSNLIVLQGGTHELTNPLNVNYNCSIVSCDDAIIENNTIPKFFTVKTGCNLLIRHIDFKHKNISYSLNEFNFINENNNDPLTVMMHVLNSKLELTLDKSEYMINDTLVKISGKLTDEDNNPLANKQVSLSFATAVMENTPVDTYNVTTDNNGEFNSTVDIKEKFSDVNLIKYVVSAEYQGDYKYLSKSTKAYFDVIEVPIVLSSDVTTIRKGETATLTADYLPLTTVEFNFNGSNQEKTKNILSDETGKAITTLKGLAVGQVEVTVKYGVTTSNAVIITVTE